MARALLRALGGRGAPERRGDDVPRGVPLPPLRGKAPIRARLLDSIPHGRRDIDRLRRPADRCDRLPVPAGGPPRRHGRGLLFGRLPARVDPLGTASPVPDRRSRRGLVAEPCDGRAPARAVPGGDEADERGDRRAPLGSIRSTRDRCCTRSAPKGKGTWTRIPRRRDGVRGGSRGGARLAIEVAAFGVLSIVVLVFIGVVVASGRDGLKPPARTLVIAQTQDFASLDPALAQGDQAWELEYATCAKLLDYRPVAGYRGTRARARGGRGDAADLAGPAHVHAHGPSRLAVLRRIARDGCVLRACVRTRALAGAGVAGVDISTRRGRLACVGPDTHRSPASRCAGLRAAPGAPVLLRGRRRARRTSRPTSCRRPGPTRSSSYQPGRSLLLRRNPYYHGTRPGRLPAILYRFGAYPRRSAQLERGDVDYGVVDAAAFQALQARFKADRSRFHVARETTVAYLALNTQRPLFRNNPQLRRAVSYALDRPELARQFGVGGAEPTDEYLPPGFPGYEPRHVYPSADPIWTWPAEARAWPPPRRPSRVSRLRHPRLPEPRARRRELARARSGCTWTSGRMSASANRRWPRCAGRRSISRT